MFRQKRSDTLAKSIERTHGIDLRVRADMKLETLLINRGYESLSQLLRAFHGSLKEHPCYRKAFLSFHYEDLRQAQGFRLMLQNENLELFLDESESRSKVQSLNDSYVRFALKSRIISSDIVICLMGNATGHRDWVDWELITAINNKIPICGIRLNGTKGLIPAPLKEANAPLSTWFVEDMIRKIEQAIARGI